MKQHEGHWYTDLPDLIRMNQLVRGRIDYAAFEAWYHSLPRDQQDVLLDELLVFALQAGVNDDVLADALQLAMLPISDPVVQSLMVKDKHGSPDWRGLDQLIASAHEPDRLKALRLSVFLFGVAEGRVFRQETKEGCNHWWHRDLLDERVVQSLFSNPKFSRTSMKDDDAIKNPTSA
jgi:hypothetical protein